MHALLGRHDARRLLARLGDATPRHLRHGQMRAQQREMRPHQEMLSGSWEMRSHQEVLPLATWEVQSGSWEVLSGSWEVLSRSWEVLSGSCTSTRAPMRSMGSRRCSGVVSGTTMVTCMFG